MDPRHAILFEPVQIGPKTLPNRFYQVPHASGFGSRKPRTHAAFRGIKAEGGWGGVNVDYAPVSSDSDETPAIASEVWEESDMRALGLVVDAVHAHGSLAGIELYHGGSESLNGESRNNRIAPSQIGSEWKYASLAKEMTASDIRRVQDDFVLAARRARDVGFDIVYVYGAHGYLMTQWLSPHTNRRTDGYGGSLANRARFQRETLERVRDAVGDDCAVAIRMAVHGGDELVGIEIDEMLEFVAMIDPLVDLFDVNVGGWPEDSGTSRYYEEGSQRPWTMRVREATAKPIVGVGRYTNPDTMAAVIRSGAIDLIGAARPAIADPFLPTKIREGRVDEIRECTGSNLCILREETFHHVGCMQNATAGEEYRRGWHPELFERPVDPERAILVVGGGPAGMECAMVLGRRGYEAVHLVEGEAELGGKMRWTRQLPTLGDWGRVIDHRVIGLSKLDNVSVILGRRLEVADVLDYGADTVVVATGSAWCGDGSQPHHVERIAGAEAALTPEQVMAGARPAGLPRRGLRHRRLLRRPRHRRAAGEGGLRDAPRDDEARGVAGLGRVARGRHAAPPPAPARCRLPHRPHAARDRRRRGLRRDRVRRPVDARGRRRRARDAAALGLGALRRAGRGPGGARRRRASVPCTGWATRWRRACRPRRSSTATGSAASSTAPTRRSRCPSSASAPPSDRPRRNRLTCCLSGSIVHHVVNY